MTSSADEREEILSRLGTEFQGVPSAPARLAYRDPLSGKADIGRCLFESLQRNQMAHYQSLSTGDLLDMVANHVYSQKMRRVAVAQATLPDLPTATEALRERLPGVEIIEASGLPAAALAECDAGVSGCIALLARTGTLVARGDDASQLGVSLLPRVHICVGAWSKVFPGVEEWLAGPGVNADGNLVFISGPSRTADIEKQVVIGVHGPHKVVVFMLGLGE